MMIHHPFPGSAHQQGLLQIIAQFYAGDDRPALAVILYGSLGRGGGDAYSDLDLAVIVREDVQVDTEGELARLSAALAEHGETVLWTQAAGEAGYQVPQSLCGVSIDYTHLRGMSPYALEGCAVLAGSLDLAAVREAAAANQRPQLALNVLVHQALWLALGLDIALQRRQFWQALPWLQPLRGALLDIFAAGRGGKRSHQVFAEAASAELQAKFGRTLPAYVAGSPEESLQAVADALAVLLDLMEQDLDELSGGQVQLGPGEREFIGRLRGRQAALRRGAGQGQEEENR